MRTIQTFVNGGAPTVDDLPVNDRIGSVRKVAEDGKNYICVAEDLDVRTQWREYINGEIQEPVFE